MREDRTREQALAELMDTLADLSHRINNPLTSLLGRAQLLQAHDDIDPFVKNSCEVIEASARRIAECARELSAVVRETREGA